MTHIYIFYFLTSAPPAAPPALPVAGALFSRLWSESVSRQADGGASVIFTDPLRLVHKVK